MKQFKANPAEILKSGWSNRHLIASLINRDILGRYRGSVLGVLWTMATPILMLAIYTFVFGIVFKTKWTHTEGTNLDFAMLLFAGLIVFNIFSEVVSRSPTLITGNPNYVKKIVFPLEILPSVTLGTALFHAAISLAVWLTFYCILFGTPHSSVVYFPLVIAPIIFLSLGFAWFLAALGVYLRDINQIVGLFITANMFLSSVFYPLSALPEEFRSVIIASPITSTIENFRRILFFGTPPDWSLLAAHWAITLSIALIGFTWFQKTRRGFADVI